MFIEILEIFGVLALFGVLAGGLIWGIDKILGDKK